MEAFTGSSHDTEAGNKELEVSFLYFILPYFPTFRYKSVQLHGQEGEVDAQLHKTHAKSANHFIVLPLYLPRLHHTQAPLGAAELEEDWHEDGVHQDPELLQARL
jgi:hypothetical protein